MTHEDQLAALVGIPYRLNGADLDGWDCLGCARHVRTQVFGLPWRSDGIEYGPGEALDAQLRAARISDRLADWTLLGATVRDMRPGAVLLFQYFGSASHVGVAISPRDFIHCLGGSETVIVDFDREPQWERRLRGVYD